MKQTTKCDSCGEKKYHTLCDHCGKWVHQGLRLADTRENQSVSWGAWYDHQEPYAFCNYRCLAGIKVTIPERRDDP